MSCCGNKRKEWLKEVRSASHHKTIEKDPTPLIPDKPERVFEYTGNFSLIISGVATGKPYHFRFKGDKIKVEYNDSFALMAERDLKILPSKPGS